MASSVLAEDEDAEAVSRHQLKAITHGVAAATRQAVEDVSLREPSAAAARPAPATV